MATPSVQTQEVSSVNSNLLNCGGVVNMKKRQNDIPLALNTKGSLIELAHKLKWAHKHFCPSEKNEPGICSNSGELSWQNGVKKRPELDPSQYVIQNLYSDGRPHPLLAYGEALFQNAIQGQQCSYTSLGTVHSYNGAVNNTRNGYLPFSSALARSRLIQQSKPEVMDIGDDLDDEEEDENGMNIDALENMSTNQFENEENLETSIKSLPDSKHELMERFLRENQEILQVKPSMNGVVGPSLWSLLTSTKEVKELDHQKLMECYKVRKNNSEGFRGNFNQKKDEECDIQEVDCVTLKENFSENGDLQNGIDCEQVDMTEVCNSNPIENLEMKEGENEDLPINSVLIIQPTSPQNMDDSSQTANLDDTVVMQPGTPADVRDRMVAPLNELEISAICSSAVDFVVKHKTPAKVLTQLSAMQNYQNRQPIQILPQTERYDKAKPGEVLRKYKCPNCVYQTDNKSHLRRHVSSVHFIGMPYYCYICSKEFPRSEKVKAHFLKMHADVEYDHRLVRKDNFFGVDYSPETTAMRIAQETLQKLGPDGISVKLTPKNMRTSNMSPAKSRLSPVSSSASVMLGMIAKDDILSSVEGMDSSIGAESRHGLHAPQNTPEVRKPIWKSPSKSEAGEKKYYCPQCPYTGKDIWHLKRHVNDVHQQRKDLKCPMCDYSTGRKHRLVTHMKNHGQLFCFHCDFSTDNLLIFQAHVKVCSLASRRAQHKCPRCDRACTNRKQLQDHQFRQHGVIVFCCSKCMFYSENDEEYQQHLLQHQNRQEGYVCQVCNEVLSDYRSLRTHLSTHKQTTTPNTIVEKQPKSAEKKTQQKLKCPSCEFESPYYHIMKEHKLIHQDNFLKCDVADCDFTTVWPLSMEHHRKIQHLASPGSLEKSPMELGPKGKGTFICPVCQDNRPPFRYKRSFDKHMAQHKEDEEKCPLCPQVFYFRASLKQHLKQDHQARVIEVSSSDGESSDSSESTESDSDMEQPQRLQGLLQPNPVSQMVDMQGHLQGPVTIGQGSLQNQEHRQGSDILQGFSNYQVHGSVHSQSSPPSLPPLPTHLGSLNPGVNYPPGTSHVQSEMMMRPTMSQAAIMEAYGPGAILHGSMAPFM